MEASVSSLTDIMNSYPKSLKMQNTNLRCVNSFMRDNGVPMVTDACSDMKIGSLTKYIITFMCHKFKICISAIPPLFMNLYNLLKLAKLIKV